MANCCNFEMMIKGKKENVNKMIGYLKANYDYNDKRLMFDIDKHFFRVQSVEILDEGVTGNEHVVVRRL